MSESTGHPGHNPGPAGHTIGHDVDLTVAELVNDGILVHQDGRIAYVNPALARLLGRPPADLCGTPVGDLAPPADQDGLSGLERAGPDGRRLTLRDAAGGPVPVAARASQVSYEGRPATLLVLRNLALEDQLSELTAEYDLIFDHTQDVFFLLKVGPDGVPRLRRINATAERVTGFDNSAVRGRRLRGVIGPVYREFAGHLATCLADREPVSFELSTPNDGAAVTWSCNLVPVVQDGQVSHVVGSAHDISERKQMEEAIRLLSFNDKLTGIYNRRYFEEELHRLEGGRAYPITIVCSDVDGLKLINDTLGHRAGDRLLKAFGGLLKRVFRKSDVVARVGGDEFAVAMTETSAEVAAARCRQLADLVETYNQRHPKLPLSVSFGQATSEGPATSLEKTFIEADKNMYQDKVGRTTTAADALLRALVAALARKDRAGADHATILGTWTRRLGQAVGLGRKELADLMLLAEMHDIGKVGVPDKLLNKRGRLTPEEREQVQQHAMLGYRIARSSPELAHIADLILHHHEWYDGSGYPMGLAGEDIPLACRILGITDAYAAMTSDTPYRAALSVERAVQELKLFAGIQFDPDLVETFVELVAAPA